MDSDRYMPEALDLTAIGLGALSIAAAIAFALVAGYVVTHLGVGPPQPWVGAHSGIPPRIQAKPILQPNPEEDIRAFSAEKRALLHGYAWADPEHAFARIPIERAMAIVAQSSAGQKP